MNYSRTFMIGASALAMAASLHCGGCKRAAPPQDKESVEANVFSELVANMVSVPDRDYSICKYEVTQNLWETVMGENPSHFKNAKSPVEGVSWNDCQEFLKKLNESDVIKDSGLKFRLPTEEEWVFACGAGARGGYCKLSDGEEITEDTLGAVAWFEDNSGKTTHPVGQKEPNGFGLYDMHGNVWEWCQERLEEVSPWTEGMPNNRIYRGGSWLSQAWVCLASFQQRGVPDMKADFIGLRLAADIAK